MKSVKLQSYTQTWFEVFLKRQRLILVEPLPKLYNEKTFLNEPGVANTRLDEPFKLLVTNVGPTTADWKSNKVVVEIAESHPKNLAEWHISYAEIPNRSIILRTVPEGRSVSSSKWKSKNNSTLA